MKLKLNAQAVLRGTVKVLCCAKTQRPSLNLCGGGVISSFILLLLIVADLDTRSEEGGVFSYLDRIKIFKFCLLKGREEENNRSTRSELLSMIT